MMTDAMSTSREYFDKLYKSSVDPFHNWKNEYEDSKRETAMSLLTRERYSNIFEPGCGNGALTLDLAARTEKIISVDWSQDALNAAALHCAGVSHVEFRQMDFPLEIPNEKFDLVVISELLYYFSELRLKRFFDVLPTLLQEKGEVLLVHWRGLSSDYPSSGDEVHDAFHRQGHFSIEGFIERPEYLVSVGRLK